MDPLPIDAHLENIVTAVAGGRDLVLTAPPGSGKTTRVPAALLDAGLPGGGRIVVLEPRRIAARLAARRVAFERGGEVGGEVGYQVRFERRAGKDTRLLFLTEGLLTRRLLHDAALDGISVVVFDEFHERSLHADLALGMVREVQTALRPDLRIVVMSATLDAESIAESIGAQVIVAEGRQYPVEVEYAERRDDERTHVRAARAVRRLIDRSGGALPADTLVFLPGVGEILRTTEELAPVARSAGFDLRPLFGELPVEEQDLAVKRGERPRVVLATNVAETSVTLDGITVVVDTGLARVPRHEPRSGVDRLVLERITRSSAEQRAGRAGRQGPGRCVRLYTRGEEREMLPALEPEVLRLDLAETVLALKAWGCREPAGFPWVTPPPAAALGAALDLLAMLGAIESAGGVITDLGRQLVDLPVHPRVGRMLLAARELACGRDGALLAALCQSRPLLRGSKRTVGRSDLLLLRDLFLEAQAARFDRAVLARLALDPRGVRAVAREAEQLTRLVRAGRDERPDEQSLLRCVLAGYPDRVARRRAPGSAEALLVGGFAAELDESSSVRDAELFVALDATGVGGGRKVRVRVASAVEADWLEELFPGAVREETQTVWNEQKGRAEGRRRRCYRDLLLAEVSLERPDEAVAAELLAKAGTHPRFLERLRTGRLERTLLRIDCLRNFRPDLGLPDVGDAELARAVEDLCPGRTSLSELMDAPLEEALLSLLAGGVRLSQLVPERIRVPSGRLAPITYRKGQPPLVSARLQEFFGARQSPRIADGRIVLAVDLLAPNGRSVQITTDLANFWENLYPRERRALSRRYPRHPWPEDPLRAEPTARPLPRRER